MKREEFKKIIKIMSFWDIDKRRGNYRLPNNSPLSEYLEELTMSFLKQNKLAITADGSIEEVLTLDTVLDPTKDWKIIKPLEEDEVTEYLEQCERVQEFVKEFF